MIEKYEWYVFERDCTLLVNKLQFKEFDGVFGIPRGGLVLAIRLSYLLDIPLKMKPTGNTLIVDDIADTGKTLLPYKTNPVTKNCMIVTLYHKEGSQVVPDIYLRKKSSSFIVFPWERDGPKEGQR